MVPALSKSLSSASAPAATAEPIHSAIGKKMPPMANQIKIVTGNRTRVNRNAPRAGIVPTPMKPAPGNRRPKAAALYAVDERLLNDQRPNKDMAMY